MAADTGKTLLLVGGLGIGGYLIWEYMQYNNAISALAGGNASQIAAAQSTLPFLTYIGFNWGGASSGTQTQQRIYALIQQYLTTGTAPGAAPTAPGTTTGTQPTTVSTAPPTTTTVNASTAPTTTTPPPPAPAPVSKVPIVSYRPGLAVTMQQKINMSMANADQWNYAYGQIMGQGIDSQYGFSFDSVYGPVVNGARSSGTMSAGTFLQMAASAVAGGLTGFGSIATYGGPALTSVGNMIYAAHHPFPYVPTYTLKGLGAPTEATGMEKTIFARLPLRSNRIR